MERDICVPVADGIINVRVGAIIEKNGKLLMVQNDEGNYCYSVGGRIQLGESAEDALRRELREETGCALEIERLGFIHEGFFLDDRPSTHGKLIYEIAFYFYVITPADFEPHLDGIREEGRGEYLGWIAPDAEKTFYPEFFRTVLTDPCPGVRHIVTDERNL